jgi:hypothetical protein
LEDAIKLAEDINANEEKLFFMASVLMP